MNGNKGISENLVSVRRLLEIRPYKPTHQIALCALRCVGLGIGRFIDVNFSKLKYNQIWINDIVFSYCHLCKISVQIFKCEIFPPHELTVTLSTLWCYLLILHSIKLSTLWCYYLVTLCCATGEAVNQITYHFENHVVFNILNTFQFIFIRCFGSSDSGGTVGPSYS